MGSSHQGDDIETGRVNVPDGSVAYTVQGAGPVVVFAHGLGGNQRSWWQQVGPFGRRFRCVSFSHRGFDPSWDSSGAPRPTCFASDLRCLLDHLGVETASIVGQSMGGWTAMEFALAHPGRVDALVLCGTTGTLRHAGLRSLGETAADPRIQAWRAAGIQPAAGARMAEEQPELHRMFVDIDRASGTFDRAAVRAALDAMRVRSPADIAGIGCPTLAMVGEEDLICPPGNVAILAEVMANCERHVVPRAGHSVYFERAETFNAMTLDFLRRQGLSS